MTTRAFHIINLSLPKTGSASLARIFGKYRSFHELAHVESVDFLLDRLAGSRSDQELDAYLLARDAAVRPEFDSATFLHLAVDRLPRIFPEARFIIAIRPCDDWAASFLGMMLEAFGPGGWGGALPAGWVDRYAGHVSQTLAGLDLKSRFAVAASGRSLAAELAEYWGRRTLDTLAAAQSERTLVLDTSALRGSTGSLERFAGVPADSLRSGVHANRGRAAGDARRLLGEAALAEASAKWDPLVEAAVEQSACIRPDEM